jgi:LmbE family N-acetylglucosaminyl deacetylase
MAASRHGRLAVLVWLALGGAAASGVGPQTEALEPVSTGGLPAVDRALAKLSSHRRLLIVGAHPDDEDTTLLAWVSRQLGGEAAYLSLTRGEGGQNVIGAELGEALGVLRTEELLAARRVDGARQYFTRAVDFGYTRSLAETLRRWPREEILLDAVRVLRRFKPQVIVSIFPRDGRGGHGQHQAAGVIAYELWRVSTASDEELFPPLAEEGLPPWRPQALYRAAWWSQEEATLEIGLTGIEPLSGRSTRQIAAASRSRHRSQDMGRSEPLGPAAWPLSWEDGGAGAGSTEPFDGIDTRLSAIASSLAPGARRDELQVLLADVERRAVDARAALSPVGLEAAAAPLATIVERLRSALDLLRATDDGAATAVAELVTEKLAAAEAGLLAAAGIALDARADREEVLPGAPLEVIVELWNSGGEPLRVDSLRLEAAPAWSAPGIDVESPELASGALGSWTAAWTTGELSPTFPYFLARAHGDLYDWSAAAVAVRGEPFGEAPLAAVAELTLRGTRVAVRRPVVHVEVDQVRGEIRRPLRAVPPVEVATRPELVLWPLAQGRSRRIDVQVRSHLEAPATATLDLAFAGREDLPIEPLPIEVPAAGGAVTVPVELPSPGPTAGRFDLVAVVTVEGGRDFDGGVPLVDYPHIRPQARPVPARTTVRRLDIVLPALRNVGYVRGASDRVPEVLVELGVPLELVPAADLATTDLDRFDVIVLGSRAYELEASLGAATPRLLAWVEAGGTVLVQYQQYQYVDGGFAPAGLSIARPHGRVTDETSVVRILTPDHPALRYPNRLGPDDWLDWVQERGLYFADAWQAPFVPLLALQDSGEAEQRGGLLVAAMGEGTYVYTGLAFFRQLPAGVPGAVRLFVNLLALGERRAG